VSIINSNFTRIRKSKMFWIGAVFVLLIACFFIFQTYENNLEKIKYIQENPDIKFAGYDTKENLHCFYYFTGFVVAVLMIVCPILIGTDNESGTIRNMIVSGKSRTSIYFANIITAICMALVYIIVWTIPMVTVGMSLFERVNTWADIFIETLLGIVIVLIFTIIYTSITMLVESNKIATIICMVISALFAISAVVLESYFNDAQLLKRYIDQGKESYNVSIAELKSDIDLSEKKIKSNLLDESQKQSEEKNIEQSQQQLEATDTYDNYLRCHLGNENVKKVKEGKKTKTWVTLFRINLVNQGLFYMEFKDDSYVYKIDGTRYDKEEEKLPYLQEVEATEEYMAKKDAEEYLANLNELSNGKSKGIDDDEKIKEEEKIEKEYLEIEKELFKDEDYKKMVEKRVESTNKDRKLNEQEEMYSRFDIKEALIFDLIFSVILIAGTYTIFLKKNID